MRNKKSVLQCLHKSDFSIKENRFIFDGPEDLGDKLKAAGVELLDAATKLVTLSTDIVGKAVHLVEKGFSMGESGVRKITEWVENPGSPEKLEEYSELSNSSSPNYIPKANDTGDAKLNTAVEGYRRMAFLEIKIKELTAFNQPFLNEFQRVESMRKEIYNRNRQLGDRFIQLDRDVSRTEAALKGNTLLSNDPRRAKLVSDLAKFREARDQMKAYLSYIVDWDKPQIQPTEYPRASGIPCDRFLPNTGLKVKLSIRDLYNWMKDNGEKKYAILIKKYEKEMEKLDYHSQKLFNGLSPALQLKGIGLKNQIDTKAKEIKNGISTKNFKALGAPRDLVGFDFVDKTRVQQNSTKSRKALIDSL